MIDPTMMQAPEMGNRDMSQFMPNEPGQDIAGQIEQNLNALDDKMKALVANNLTVETAMMCAAIFGEEEVFQALQPYIDPNVILVPVDRQSATSGQSTPSGTPEQGSTQQQPKQEPPLPSFM